MPNDHPDTLETVVHCFSSTNWNDCFLFADFSNDNAEDNPRMVPNSGGLLKSLIWTTQMLRTSMSRRSGYQFNRAIVRIVLQKCFAQR